MAAWQQKSEDVAVWRKESEDVDVLRQGGPTRWLKLVTSNWQQPIPSAPKSLSMLEPKSLSKPGFILNSPSTFVTFTGDREPMSTPADTRLAPPYPRSLMGHKWNGEKFDFGTKVEGFWAIPSWGWPGMNWEDPKQRDELKRQLYSDPYPRPTGHPAKWYGQDEFAKKLELVEKKTFCLFSDGASFCRFSSDCAGGATMNGEYYRNGVCWPSGFRTHDMELHNVCPAEHFFRFIEGEYNKLKREHTVPLTLP